MSSERWGDIERGAIQRAELLNLVLADLYGPRELLRRRLVPPSMRGQDAPPASVSSRHVLSALAMTGVSGALLGLVALLLPGKLPLQTWPVSRPMLARWP